MATQGREGQDHARRRSSRGGGTALGATVAELVGTYVLVFVGTGAVVAYNTADAGDVASRTGIALAFGIAVLVVVYALGHVSGAHLNPSVTLALAAVRKFPVGAIFPYLVAQVVGAVLASLTVWALFGARARSGEVALGATTPGDGVSDGVALLAEFVITLILLVVVMGTATDERSSAPAVGLGVGLTISAAIFVTLTISGGSLNLARTLGPALVTGSFDSIWVYVVGPVAGGIVGAFLYELVLRSGEPPDVAGAVEEKPKQRT